MTYVKINDSLYPATIEGKVTDRDWGNRESKSITLEMGYAEASDLFVDNTEWSIVQRHETPAYQMNEDGAFVLDENGNLIQTGTNVQETEFDNSEYCLAGAITDHRDGTITVKMGKLTQVEELEAKLANAVSEEELAAAYEEGVNRA